MSLNAPPPLPPSLRAELEQQLARKDTAQSGLASFYICHLCSNVEWAGTNTKLPPGARIEGWIHECSWSMKCGVCEDFRARHPEVFYFIELTVAWAHTLRGA